MRVQLRPSFFVLVDECDAHLFESYSYRPHTSGYAQRSESGTTRYLHRDIVQPSAGQSVDHVNGIRHDCRRENLRVATSSQNMQNRGAVQKAGRSRFKGVVDLMTTRERMHGRSFENRYRFAARIKVNEKTVHIGTFQTEEEAAKAYDLVAYYEHGEFARLNFPEEGGVSAALAAPVKRAA